MKSSKSEAIKLPSRHEVQKIKRQLVEPSQSRLGGRLSKMGQSKIRMLSNELSTHRERQEIGGTKMEKLQKEL